MTSVAAYLAYGVGSVVFLAVAFTRGSPAIAAGSALFLLGTLLMLAQQARQRRPRDHRGRSSRQRFPA